VRAVAVEFAVFGPKQILALMLLTIYSIVEESDNMNLIGKDKLVAIKDALALGFPGLSKHIEAVLSQTPEKSEMPKPGEPVAAQCRVDLPEVAVGDILEALKQIEGEQGREKVFGGRPISLLVAVWRGIKPSWGVLLRRRAISG
jgi:hypothetical protein